MPANLIAVYPSSPYLPSFSPASESFSGTVVVTLTAARDNAQVIYYPLPTIYYTTDGSTPTKASTVYTGPITISATTTVKAVSTVGQGLSPVVSATYNLNLSPVGWWKFNAASQAVNTLLDSSGNNNSLTPDGYSWGSFPGYAGIDCIPWNGSSRNAQAASGSIPALQFSGLVPMSITAWFNIYGSGGALVNTQDSANGYQGYGLYCMTPSSGEIYFNMVNANNSFSANATSNTGGSLQFNTSYMVGVTYDGSGLASGIKMYINGVSVPVTPSGAGLSGHDCTSAAPLTVGSIPNNPFSYGIQGNQTDTRIYAGVLGADQIASMFAAGPTP